MLNTDDGIDLKKNESWEKCPKTKDGQFGCLACRGTGENPLPMGGRCFCCNGSGYMIDWVNFNKKAEIGQHNDTRKELRELKDWIKTTSKCSLCHGDSYKTFGGTPCKECGLIGSQPWGG